MNDKHPLISCVCITGNRHLVLRRAIVCFSRQDYPNTELVISYPEQDLISKTIIDQMSAILTIQVISLPHSQNDDIRLIQNKAIEQANGNYVCFWNDQHWHHISRLSDQYITIKNNPFKASILMHILLFDFHQQKTYHSAYWEWQDTLLCEKEILLEAVYIDIEKKDYAHIIHFLSYKNILHHLAEAPHLYIYIGYEGKETDPKEFNYYCQQGEIKEEINQTVQDLIDLDYYLQG
jgi:hypothetical protein